MVDGPFLLGLPTKQNFRQRISLGGPVRRPSQNGVLPASYRAIIEREFPVRFVLVLVLVVVLVVELGNQAIGTGISRTTTSSTTRTRTELQPVVGDAAGSHPFAATSAKGLTRS